MTDIRIRKVNEVYLYVDAEPHFQKEMSEYFTFYVPGYQFSPAFQNRFWDGKIRMMNARNNQIYHGITHYITEFARQRNYSLEFDDEIILTNNFSMKEAYDFAKSLDLPFEPRDFQIKGFCYGIRNKRNLFLSPTASGKSLISYLLTRYMLPSKGLIVVPTINLVEQLYKDFGDYSNKNGFNVENVVHRVYAGHSRETDKPITISTWQSLYKLPEEFFIDFKWVIGDEAHLFKAQSLTAIMTKLTNAEIRIGMTGTLDGSKTHKIMLEGLFGPVRQLATTKALIEKGQLSPFLVKTIILHYPDNVREKVKKLDYHKEIDFLVANEARNAFLKNLLLSLNDNTILLFNFVDKHGKILYNITKDESPDVHLIYGKTDIETREELRGLMETQNKVKAITSYGVFSVGVNIKNLHNIIFGAPYKGRIRVLQSIGRGLRMLEGKDRAVLYDIVDDLRIGDHENFAIKHFKERMNIYTEEGFPYKTYHVNLGE